MGKNDIITKNLKVANQSLTHMGNLDMGKIPTPTKDIVTKNLKAANQSLIHMGNLAMGKLPILTRVVMESLTVTKKNPTEGMERVLLNT